MKFPVLWSGLVSRVGASHRANLMHLSPLVRNAQKIAINIATIFGKINGTSGPPLLNQAECIFIAAITHAGNKSI